SWNNRFRSRRAGSSAGARHRRPAAGGRECGAEGRSARAPAERAHLLEMTLVPLAAAAVDHADQRLAHRTQPAEREHVALEAANPMREEVPAVDRGGHSHRHDDPRRTSLQRTLPLTLLAG